jgi:hypothetical protein
MERQENNHCLQGLLSPSHLAKLSPRISFTYKTPANNTRSQLTTAHLPIPLQATLQSIGSKTELGNPLSRRKADRCKICSN